MAALSQYEQDGEIEPDGITVDDLSRRRVHILLPDGMDPLPELAGNPSGPRFIPRIARILYTRDTLNTTRPYTITVRIMGRRLRADSTPGTTPGSRDYRAADTSEPMSTWPSWLYAKVIEYMPPDAELA